MEWGAAVTGILALILWGLKQWAAAKPQRDQEQSYDDIQQGRADIANGNADAVNGRIDRLLSGQSYTQGQHGTEDLSGRIADLTGASILPGAGNNGPDTGASGSLQGAEGK